MRNIRKFVLLFFLVLSGCFDESNKSIEPQDFPLDTYWPFEHIVIDPSPPATYRINDIFAGDVNGDNLIDIITTGRGAGADAHQMVWYENPSWKRFGIYPGDFKYGNCKDLDNDGDLDIVANNYWFENVAIDDQITWNKHALDIDITPDLVLIGDINNDDWNDIIIIAKHELRVLKNELYLNGSWQSYKISEDRMKHTGGDLGDIDGDGDVDILWGNTWHANPLNTGGHTWGRYFIDPDWPSEARGFVSDVNHDGKLDVILTGEESDIGISWFEAPSNLSSDRWIKHVVVDKGYHGIHSLSAADFDLDGDMDIFAAEMHHGANPDKVAIFENADGSGGHWHEHILSNDGSHNAKVVDLNNDNYPDIIGKNYEKDELPLRIDAWINPKAEPQIVVDLWPYHIVDNDKPWKSIFIDSGDINGDGQIDIVTGAWWYQNPSNIASKWERHAISNTLKNLAIVFDFDQDGDIDILGTTGELQSNEFVWSENDGKGNFTEHTSIDKGIGDFLQGARIIQIGKMETYGVVLSWHNNTSTQLLRIPSDSTQPWKLEEISSYTNGEQIAVGDVDRDGDLDIHLGRVWLRSDGNTWSPLNVLRINDNNADPDRVELADINNDGRMDVIIGCEHSKRLLWGQAPPNASDPWQENLISKSLLAMSLDKADIDGDGDVDIVAGEHNAEDPSKGKVVLFINQGNGQRWKNIIIGQGFEHHDGTRFVDIDADGDLDVISIGWTHKNVIIYENPSVHAQDKKLPDLK